MANTEVLNAMKKQAHVMYKAYKSLEEAVAEKRKALDDEIARMEAQFGEVYGNLIANLEEAKKGYEQADEQLRNEAVNFYQMTGEKQIDDHLSVRVNTSLDYDQDKALTWATEHNLCLTLDKKAFEKVAGTVNLDFVQKVEKPTAVVKKEMYENYG